MNILKTPYEFRKEKRRCIRISALFGLFIFAFLVIFQPLNLNVLSLSKIIIVALGLGLVTSAVLLIFYFVIEPVFTPKKWNMGREIVWAATIAATIGVVNYIYILTIFDMTFSLYVLSLYILIAIVIGSIPVSIQIIIEYNRSLRNRLIDSNINIESSEELQTTITINAENPKHNFTCPANKILYLTSSDNYINIVYTDNNNIKSEMIRATLKSAEDDLNELSQFIRCHKGYIVNTNNIESYRGNSQNLKLKIKQSNEEVPVSRKNGTSILQLIHNSCSK